PDSGSRKRTPRRSHGDETPRTRGSGGLSESPQPRSAQLVRVSSGGFAAAARFWGRLGGGRRGPLRCPSTFHGAGRQPLDEMALQIREQDGDRHRADDDAGGELAPLDLVL